jgi:D-inositol-3-phosphate glycosyltransferase
MKQRVARQPDEAEGDYRVQGEREVMRLAERIVAATPAEQAQLQWLYQIDTRKVAVIPPGVDLSHFYPIPADEAKEVIGIPPCERLVLFVGRIEPLKGIDTLIQAIAILRSRGFYMCLSVIGGEPDSGGGEMERLREMCQQAGLDDLIAFLGKKAQETLPYYYSAAEVVVVPSFYESFGMVALEAMACGTPVVASQVGGLAYLVQDCINGFSVPVDDPQLLADRLMELLSDKELRETMGRNAAQSAREYAWPKITERIVKLYAEVLANGATRASPSYPSSRPPDAAS